ncbi:hypothetical protein BDF21DRAFT_400990 [Thamnidium elegans]|nr:hypothetical protein BDF21DRAFT_400990 [Thamnidium elegans]
MPGPANMNVNKARPKRRFKPTVPLRFFFFHYEVKRFLLYVLYPNILTPTLMIISLLSLKKLPGIYNYADIIAPVASKNTTIVLIQNGLGVEEPNTDRFPNKSIFSIVAYVSTS